jgi:hypothetical protein
MAAVSERAAGMAYDERGRRQMVQHSVGGDRVKPSIDNRKLFCIGNQGVHNHAGVVCLLLCLPQQRFGQVERDDVMPTFGEPQRNTSRPGANVQHDGTWRERCTPTVHGEIVQGLVEGRLDDIALVPFGFFSEKSLLLRLVCVA